MENKNLIEFIMDFFNFKGLAKGVKKSSEIIKIELQISKLNKEKFQKLKELGLLVYEFYHLDKNLKNDEEIQDLISEIKEIDDQISELEKKIEEIRIEEDEKNSNDKNEIENELLKNTQTESKEDKTKEDSNGENKASSGTDKKSE